MAVDQLRVEAQERVDLQDFQTLADNPVRQAAHLPDAFITNPSGGRSFVIDGFAISNPSAKQLQVTKGRAILPRREGGQILYGMVTTEGDATRIVDMTSFAAGTYGIYIRFEFIDGDQNSRIKWNATGDGFEYSETIATRRKANWQLRVEASNPGAEWLQIGTVSQAAMTIVDMRPLYFEGQPDLSYAEAWGTGNDRNADRATYGIKDLQTFTRAMRQCLEDIKGVGLRQWYEADVGGMNVGFIASPVEGRVALEDANFYLQGNGAQPSIVFDANDSIIYTRALNRWDFGIASAPKLAILQDGAGPAIELGGDANDRLIHTSGGPRWLMDTTDYFQYVRTTNQFEFFTGSTRRAFITSAGEVVASQFLAAQSPAMPAAPGIAGFSFENDGARDTGMFSTGDGDIGWYANGSRRAEIIAGTNNSALRCRAVTPILNLTAPTNQLDLVMRHARNCVLAYGGIDTGGNIITGSYNVNTVTPLVANQLWLVDFIENIAVSGAAAVMGLDCPNSPTLSSYDTILTECRHAAADLVVGAYRYNSNTLAKGNLTFGRLYFVVVGAPNSVPTQNL